MTYHDIVDPNYHTDMYTQANRIAAKAHQNHLENPGGNAYAGTMINDTILHLSSTHNIDENEVRADLWEAIKEERASLLDADERQKERCIDLKALMDRVDEGNKRFITHYCTTS